MEKKEGKKRKVSVKMEKTGKDLCGVVTW